MYADGLLGGLHVRPRPRAQPNPCGDGTYPLFDRPPYLADLTVRDAAGDRALDLRIVVNHLKSKRGDEAINAPRRAEQARFVAGLLTEPNSVALGDFNDPLGTPTLAQFAGYVNLYERICRRRTATLTSSTGCPSRWITSS